MNEDVRIGEFRIARGGPFYELQTQVGLIRENALHTRTRVLLLVGLTWGVPFLLSIAEGTAFGSPAEKPFLFALDVWARYLVAVGLFIMMERQIDDSLQTKLEQFVRVPLITPDSIRPAAEAVTAALKRRDSRAAEAACLAIAALISYASLIHTIDSATSSWAVRVSESGSSKTLAAWWCLFVSGPIFWFLLLRELWRHLVWSILLRRIAALKLRLVSTHPDGMGGLAFIGQYPNSYTTFIFAISCVLGAVVANELMSDRLSANVFGFVLAGWLTIVWALFIYPLLAFRKPLSELKEATLLACGAQATRYHRMVERKQLGRNVTAPEEAEAAIETDIPDPTKQFEATRKMSVLVVSRSALMPVSAAALIPLVAAGLTVLPYKELLGLVKRLLIL